MFQTRRPTGRIFYLVLAVVAAATGIRLHAAPQSGPALTSVVDTVYRADGTPAQGTLVITWPAFVQGDGTAVSAGALNVTLGTNGALSVALATNASANPPGVYYTVVYQLGPGEVRTEYWVVPASSPATLAQVRTTPGSGTAAQPVSTQYVDSALAGKANDNAVVHLAGTETVTGTKSFGVPPNVPTPVGTGDVTNKAYVDAAIATVGAGNYLPTAGGAMTGPLTLSASPTAPLQAAPKQYVDLTAASKANLVSGLVPTNELGSGTASSLNCLLGNGTWGSCGSSANATEIQSVPVGSSAPANGQVLTYSSSSGQYSPATPSGGTGGVSVTPAVSQNITQPAGTQFSVNNQSGIRYVAPSDNWSQNPSGSLSAGANTVTLNPCPRGLTVGVVGATFYAYVYISGVGTPESVLINSTTCTQAGGSSGTITFTAASSHSSGYTIGSASQGVQETILSASYPPVSYNQLGAVVIPPGQYTWQARVTVPTPYTELDFAGSYVTCTMADSCLVVGNVAEPNYIWDVTIKNFTGQAGCNNCNFPMIEDAGQHTHFVDIRSTNPNPVGSKTSGYSFGSLIQVDNDQSAVIDGLDTQQSRWSHCDTTFCSVAIKGAGGSGNAGILWIKNTNMNLGCSANGVDNQNANTMRISDSVIQSQAQFGVRSAGVYSNVPNVELDNVYFEVAGCANTNPLGIGEAGLIVENGFASVKNSVGPVGSSPLFANTGSTQYNYYVVAHCTGGSCGGGLVSSPFLAGIALTNGTGSIPVVWPQFGTTGTITYDVIRTSGPANEPAPYTAVCTGGATTTCGSVATALTVGSACSTVGSANICAFTDTASASTSSYTVTSPPSYWPAFGNGTGAGVFWPGSVVVTQTTDSVGGSASPSGVHFDRLGDNAAPTATNPVSQLVSSSGSLLPKFFAQQCVNITGGAWVSCLETDNGSTVPGATLLDEGFPGAEASGLKGRIIIEQGPAQFGDIAGSHKITLVDSNPAKTLSSVGMRPGNDANDTYVGLDNGAATSPSNAQLAFGAPVSISSYIGNAGDNTSFLERLTASSKTINVPVSVNGNMTVNGQLLVAGPWMVSSPIPGTAMAAAGAGTSALGISNDGNFYISANAGTPQKVATTASSSYFSNLIQEDANDLGEYNGTTAQNLHVYSSYTNSSTWQRISLGYDAGDSYAVLRSESSPSGSAYGLGFWINSGLKWVIDASSMHCSIAYTYMAHISLAEVRTALPSASYVTQLVGALSDGAACEITSDPSLDFYPQYVPVLNQLIVASYRGSGRAVAQVRNAASVAALQNGADDGTRGSVRVAKTPGARTDVDCENAALAILDDSTAVAWSGSYETWSDFLPGAAADIFPGDAIVVNVPSRGVSFVAIVREVGIQLLDPVDDRGFYMIGFANDLAAPLAIEYGTGATAISLQDVPPSLETTQVGEYYQTDLTEAQITAVTSTTVQVDAGMTPPSGYGIEVRENDYGWGQANDRNLLGRFSSQTFNLARLAQTQNYFLRLYDGSSPPKYSRYSAALHVDYPL